MNDFETLVVTLEDGVAHIEFNRADRANAFNRTMWHELGAVMRAVDAATGARVAVLSGRGRHFTAGIDLAFLAELQAELAPLGPGRRQEPTQQPPPKSGPGQQLPNP
jgi:enoyl-CoA hydratase